MISQAGEFYIDFQIIDGKSKDESVTIIQDYAGKFSDPEAADAVTWYREFAGQPVNCLGISFRWISEQDKGHADGVNKGIANMIGDYWAFLNSDDVYLPGALAKVTELFADNKAELIYSNADVIDENGEVIAEYPTGDIARDSLFAECFIAQPTVFMRREIVEKFGKFKVGLVSLDYEYWLRLLVGGSKFHYYKGKLAATRMYGETQSSRKVKLMDCEGSALAYHYSGEWNEEWKLKLVRNFWLKKLFNKLKITKYNDRSGVSKALANVYFAMQKEQILQIKRAL